ncbi:MAG TPA: HU family DNA-binding protein [Acidimicrobiia bacterium]|jgi:nucleoid DNA-binding protein
MNRRELVAELADRLETDKRTADAGLQAFIDTVTDTVAKGEPVAISGFAKYVRRDVPAKPRRRGRNPATGEEIWLNPKPASKSVRITPLKAFKDAVLTGKRASAKKSPAKKRATAKKAAKRAPAKKTAKKTVKKATKKTTARRR